MKYLRKCNDCGLEAWNKEELEWFAKDSTQKYGRKNYCEDCRKTRRRNDGLKAAYGITLQEYEELLQKQEGKCKICGTTDPKHKGVFHVDHNHNTGKIRGLLCHGCNTALGLFQDSPTILVKATEYLLKEGNYGNE